MRVRPLRKRWRRFAAAELSCGAAVICIITCRTLRVGLHSPRCSNESHSTVSIHSAALTHVRILARPGMWRDRISPTAERCPGPDGLRPIGCVRSRGTGRRARGRRDVSCRRRSDAPGCTATVTLTRADAHGSRDWADTWRDSRSYRRSDTPPQGSDRRATVPSERHPIQRHGFGCGCDASFRGNRDEIAQVVVQVRVGAGRRCSYDFALIRRAALVY